MKQKVLLGICLSLLMSLPLFSQAEWPQFRGPEGAGRSLDQNNYPESFSMNDNMLWNSIIAKGLSSPVVWEDKIFITGHARDTFRTYCCDFYTGELIWVRDVISDTIQRFHPISSAAAPSVATNGSQLVSYFGSYGLVCYDFDGNPLWERKLPIEANMYGVSVSPVFIEKHLIFSRDSDELSYIESIDPLSGETVWRTDRPNYRGNWSTPGFCVVDGKTQVLVYGVFSMKSYDLESGKELWILPKLTDEPATTPLFEHGLVYVTTYNMKTNPEVLGLPTYDSLLLLYDVDKDSMLSFNEIKGNKSILSRYDADGEGDHPLPGFFRWLDQDKNGQMTAKEWTKIENWIGSFDWRNALIALKAPSEEGGLPDIVWEHKHGVPECPSPLIVGDLIYMIKNGGIFSCLNAKTGELHYQQQLPAGGPYYASPVYADGKIYLASTRGIISIIKPGKEFLKLSESSLGERIMATPALVKGRILLRTDKALYAFGRK